MLGTSMMTAKIYTQNMTAFVFMVCIAFGQAVSILIEYLVDPTWQSYRGPSFSASEFANWMLITLGFSSLLIQVRIR